MRPLAVVVFAETLLIVLLGSMWLGDSAATVGSPLLVQVTPPGDDTTPVTVAATVPDASEFVQRQQVDSQVPALAMDDPVGILVGGTVRCTDGSPVADANVYFHRGDEHRGGSTQPNGAYAAVALLPGEWLLTCRADGFAAVERRVTLDQRAYQQFDFELRPAYVVKVKIQNAAGEYLPSTIQQKAWGAELSAVATATPLLGDLPITEQAFYLRFGVGEWRTNSGRSGEPDPESVAQGYAGELRLDQDPPVFVALVLRHVVLQSQPVGQGQHEVVFTLEADQVLGRLGTVTLRLIDGASGQPLPKSRISLDTSQDAVTDDDGRVVLDNVVPGLLNLSAYCKDHEYLFRYLRMPPGGKLDLGDVRLSPLLEVLATAIDADGKPVADADFCYNNLDDRTFPQPLFSRLSCPVDGSGQARLGLGAHRYVVFARSRSKGFGYTVVDASRGAPDPVTVTIEDATRVAFRCRVDTTIGYLVTVLDA